MSRKSRSWVLVPVLVVALAVSLSACLPTSSGRGDGSRAPKIEDQAEYEAVRDKAKQTMDRAMELAIEAAGAEPGEPDDPVRVATTGCDLQSEAVRKVEVNSGLRYRGTDASGVASSVARAWREAGWEASVSEQTNVAFTLDLGAGVTLDLGLEGPADTTDGDGMIWFATATTDCMDLPDDVAERIATGDLE